MNALVRPAAPADAARLADLSTALGYPMTPAEAIRRLGEIADHPDLGLLVAEIAGLIVDETARGGGIGRKLLEAAQAWARAKGCRAIRVRSNVVRERARGFYEREGFVIIKTQRVFEKPLGA